MSERERCAAALNLVPESKLGYVLAYIQGIIADVAADQEDIPNATTVAALLEGDEMLRTGSGQGWTGSTKDLFNQILGEDDE